MPVFKPPARVELPAGTRSVFLAGSIEWASPTIGNRG